MDNNNIIAEGNILDESSNQNEELQRRRRGIVNFVQSYCTIPFYLDDIYDFQKDS